MGLSCASLLETVLMQNHRDVFLKTLKTKGERQVWNSCHSVLIYKNDEEIKMPQAAVMVMLGLELLHINFE